MKSTLAVLALSVTAAGAFQAGSVSPRTSSALAMGGFLDGRGAKVTIRDDEDADMWFDDGSGGRTPSEPKKPAPKKPEAAEPKKKGGFKFPWDN
mmetsp:Transcript_26384/g.42934  ORF Transcript_26384/g.42934 Transcript_26384/m.42934 type:complete len:94 (-) Transcript_26384:401-682(-)|eukprot:CAMPEP_0196141120 /NCGR_PEP_ID=MMETSP0910-20130528/8786_1 /TAXON_ID=49265 /ORGANISM="Thalassiosira rotula, Strain GSO102" /LENGTH=93 /DNA_ID=CAMNT_0041402165 /DNA_START=80 /DNA_END=361 /DNA_ORIENTATION=-